MADFAALKVAAGKQHPGALVRCFGHVGVLCVHALTRWPAGRHAHAHRYAWCSRAKHASQIVLTLAANLGISIGNPQRSGVTLSAEALKCMFAEEVALSRFLAPFFCRDGGRPARH